MRHDGSRVRFCGGGVDSFPYKAVWRMLRGLKGERVSFCGLESDLRAQQRSIMKKWIFLAYLPALLSLFAHIYLAKRHYELIAGEFQESAICHISEKFNCDSALLSPYGKFLGISISNFGIGFNLILCLILAFFLISPPAPGQNVFWKLSAFYLSGAIALASAAMLFISLSLDLYCPVCWTIYPLSFAPPAALFFIFRKDIRSLSPIGFIKRFFQWKAGPEKTGKAGIFIAGGILAVSFFFHIAFVSAFDIKSQSEAVDAAFIDWQAEETVSFSEAPPLALGFSAALPKGSQKILIAEFADFLCPRCKEVEPALKTFLLAHKDAVLHFYLYPLDKTCNPALKHSGSGASCELSKALICGEKQKRGVFVQELIFERQKDFGANYARGEKISELLKETAEKAQLDLDKFSVCMGAPETEEKLRLSVKAGNAAGVEGTPFIYVNGKRLRASGKTLLPLLSRIHSGLN